MKVKDLIAKLQEFDPELPVCLADFADGYSDPSEEAATVVDLETDKFYWPFPELPGIRREKIVGTYVCIGGSS